MELREQKLSKDIYKRTLDAQRKQNKELRYKQSKLDHLGYSLNRKDIENFKAGKKEINALIPGINPGVIMNPNYNKESKFLKSAAQSYIVPRKTFKVPHRHSPQTSQSTYNIGQRHGSVDLRKYRVKKKIPDDVLLNDPLYLPHPPNRQQAAIEGPVQNAPGRVPVGAEVAQQPERAAGDRELLAQPDHEPDGEEHAEPLHQARAAARAGENTKQTTFGAE
jgi:hypothetical protein